MLVRNFKNQIKKSGVRYLTSATHLPVPSMKRDATISVCPGEGIGPQIVDSVMEIFDYLKVPLNTEMVDYQSLKRGEANTQLTKNKNLLMGPVSNKSYDEESKGVCHRQILSELGVYASVLNPISIPGAEINDKDIDLLIIQQVDQGFQADSDVTAEYDDISSAWITPHRKSDRIAEYAFNNAIMSRRSKVTALHQANIKRECHGEFLQKARKVAKNTPGVIYEEMYLGDGAAKIATDPESFQIIIMPSSCGDIIQSISMSLVGGNGLVPSVHLGENFTLFQQGGTNPCYDKVKEGDANPTGLILSASMMLRQVNLPSFADLIEDAVFKTYSNPEIRTPELGGNYSTKEFTGKVLDNIYVKKAYRKSIKEDTPTLAL